MQEQIQTERYFRIHRFSKVNLYVLAKKLDREGYDTEMETLVLEIRNKDKDYGYRRICGEIRTQSICVNKNKIQ